MKAQELIDTARRLVAGDKGLLAMDESDPSCNKRFATLGIPQTEKARCAYREMIVTTPGLGGCINGAILYDETIRQQKKDGTPLVKVIAAAGIIPGIKVDTGAKDMAGHPGSYLRALRGFGPYSLWPSSDHGAIWMRGGFSGKGHSIISIKF